MKGNFHVRFLGELGAGNSPRLTRRRTERNRPSAHWFDTLKLAVRSSTKPLAEEQMLRALFLSLVAVTMLCWTGAARSEEHLPPQGWRASGKAAHDYEMTIDRGQVHSGHPSGMIRAIHDKPTGFGTLMQTFIPDEFRGKRVRLSGWVRTERVENWASLWMRVDGNGPEPLAFDNMGSRPIKGTTEWRRYEIVLDVSDDATAVAFGLQLDGSGAAWMSDLEMTVVGREVPTTGESRKNTLPRQPRNLRFDE